MSNEEILKSEYRKLISNPDKVYRQNPSIIKAAYAAMDEARKDSEGKCKALVEALDEVKHLILNGTYNKKARAITIINKALTL